MIASVKGTLTLTTGEYVVIDVGGIGFKIFTSTSTLDVLGSNGETVTLLTHLHVREDNLTLFGFATEPELRIFELLLSVSGVGPKAALGILSAMPVDSLFTAIAAGSADLLTRIPGVGTKTAGRIVLELKNKIDSRHAAVRPVEMAASDVDVLAALTGLGYSLAEAQAAVRSLPANNSLSTEEKILQALRYFGEQRG
jgi:Holliday junction DNA helicase RuvA